jgi:tyrosyl-tRNA synthetase
MTGVEWLVDQMRQRKEQGLTLSFYELEMFAEKAKEMEKEREKSIFSIAYRMTPIEFGKEYCEAEFEKFNKIFKQQEQ